MSTGSQTEVVELDLTFRAIDAGSAIADRLPRLFAEAWPSYRSWWLQQGEAARESYAFCVRKLRQYMPEMVDSYHELVEGVGGGDVEARFLSHWSPPPLFGTCSLAACTRGEHVLVHNYDYSPLLCDTTVLASNWHGTKVLAMSDCTWGATDGVNSHGLSVAIAFGGRHAVGEGFGIGLVVRYILEFAADVPSALSILERVPVRIPYNVALVDRVGRGVIARTSPDRPLTLSPEPFGANRQGATEWPEHSQFCATVEREAALAEAFADPSMTAERLLGKFLEPPIYRHPATTPWGTVYTVAYDSDGGTADLAWPGERWRLSLDAFAEGSRTRRTAVALVPAAAGPALLPVEPHAVLIA
jgi:predicted choloylglycine hydrolase